PSRWSRTMKRLGFIVVALAVLTLGVVVGFILLVGGTQHPPQCAPGDSLYVAPGDLPEEVAGFSGEQLANAATIMRVGADLGVDGWGQTIGVMTAMGETDLRVLDHGDRAGPDSRGLFQQRESWGSYEDRMDPARSATMFFQALTKVDGWRDLTPTMAAHRVQRNADPHHYQKYWASAAEVVHGLSVQSTTTSAQKRYDLGPVKPHTQALAEEVGALFDVSHI